MFLAVVVATLTVRFGVEGKQARPRQHAVYRAATPFINVTLHALRGLQQYT